MCVPQHIWVVREQLQEWWFSHSHSTWSWNQGHQAWWQKSLLPEPYYQPLCVCVHVMYLWCTSLRCESYILQKLLLCPLSVLGMNRYFQPFYQPNECGKALCVRPDVMELDELYEFPEYSRDPTMYLALRNLILALWYTNCKVSEDRAWGRGRQWRKGVLGGGEPGGQGAFWGPWLKGTGRLFYIHSSTFAVFPGLCSGDSSTTSMLRQLNTC